MCRIGSAYRIRLLPKISSVELPLSHETCEGCADSKRVKGVPKEDEEGEEEGQTTYKWKLLPSRLPTILMHSLSLPPCPNSYAHCAMNPLHTWTPQVQHTKAQAPRSGAATNAP